MNLKTGFYIISVLLLISSLYSCLGNGTGTTYTSDARINSLTVSNDSIYGIDSLKFSIENSAGGGFIFNEDSLPYGTKIKRKVVLTYGTNAAGVVNVTKIDNDTAKINSGDSVAIPENKSVNGYALHLKVYAYDGTTYTYWLKIVIHQVDPDSIRYEKIATNVENLSGSDTKALYFKNTWYTFNKSTTGVSVYRSSDQLSWSATPQNGLPADTKVSDIAQNASQLFANTQSGALYTSFDAVNWVKIPNQYPITRVLGYFNSGPLNPGGLSLISLKDGSNVYSFCSIDSLSQQYNFSYGNSVDANFPAQTFGSFSRSVLFTQNFTLIGAFANSGDMTSSVWSTEDGLSWTQINDIDSKPLPRLRGASAFSYGSSIFVLNGIRDDGSMNPYIYESKDNGISWSGISTKFLFPSSYVKRDYASVLVVNGYFYIYGGKDLSGNPINDIWKCFRNKMFFLQ